MNTHEAERIAAALHQARPDWPTKQLTTLLAHPQLADRPRRDVFVALAWVASETGTANPYRVLEAGPWWKAAAIDGQTSSNRDNPQPHQRCSVCSLSQPRCRQVWANDHEFEPATVDHKRDPDAIAAIVQEARSRLEHVVAAPSDPPTITPNPRVQELRQLMPATEET